MHLMLRHAVEQLPGQAWMKVPPNSSTVEEAAQNEAKIKDLEEISDSEDPKTRFKKKSLRS